MTNTNFYKLVQSHLEEREHNNVYENLMKDKNYLKAYHHHKELIDAIHSKECTYTAVLFRMGMQYGFSIVWKLMDMK